MNNLILSLVVLFSFGVVNASFAQNLSMDIPADIQIKIALNAAPQDKKEGAKIIGYNAQGDMTVLREGNNEMICIADNPAKENIHVACYFEELEPFMARGRALAAQGKTFKERTQIRGEEVAAGKLKMPENPATLYVYDADQSAVNLTNGEISEGRLRSVIYVPFLTAEKSGLPTAPIGGGMPWLMDPGTHRAHIMITPAK